jgi:hypothetical protein
VKRKQIAKHLMEKHGFRPALLEDVKKKDLVKTHDMQVFTHTAVDSSAHVHPWEEPPIVLPEGNLAAE